MAAPKVAAIEPVRPALTPYTFKQLMFSDIKRIRPRSKPSWLGVLIALPAHPGIITCFFLRTQQILVKRGRIKWAYMTRTLCGFLTGADIAPGAHVGLGIYFVHPVGVCLGYGSRLGDDITMASGVVIGVRSFGVQEGDEDEAYARVGTIGDRVAFGAHAVVLGDVTVGDDAVIGANTVVINDVPDGAVMMGNPARRVGTNPAVEVPAAEG